MPHLHLETTADLPENAHIPDILEALTLELATHETVTAGSIKAYHTLRSVWVVGEGHAPGFAHLTLAVLSGRPVELRKRMGESMLRILREQCAESLELNEVSVTVEVREMDHETYFR